MWGYRGNICISVPSADGVTISLYFTRGTMDGWPCLRLAMFGFPTLEPCFRAPQGLARWRATHKGTGMPRTFLGREKQKEAGSGTIPWHL